jgi:pectin methylesterase-like acyl-CoA thioesterase/acetyl esterase/lipase
MMAGGWKSIGLKWNNPENIDFNMKTFFSHILFVIVCLYANCFLVFSQTVMINGVPRDTSYTLYSCYQKEKKHFPFIRLADTIVPKNLEVREQVVYKTLSETPYGKRNLYLSIYRPNDAITYPVVLMIHGGGWNSGSPEMQKALALRLAQKGFVTATVEYRLSPEAKYPAAVDDLNDAVLWLYRHADEYKIDKNKIAVSGCSAGGQLAALIGTKNRNKLIKAVINIDGISTFIEPETINRAKKAKEQGEKTPADALWLGGTYEEISEIWKDASPLYGVNGNSAPVCFINSSIPRFHNGREDYIHRLDSLGIYSEVHVFDETPHTFWHFHPWHLTTVGYAANFLRKMFDKPSGEINETYDIIVAQDGSGDFTTIQEAINAVPDFRKRPTRIFIRKGFYHEKIVIPDTKQSLFLIGEDKYQTIISYNNFASKKSGLGDEIGTSGSASIYVCPDHFTAQNLTFENAAGPVGQAVAIIVRSDNACFINCRFIGFQDTLYTHKPFSKQYYENCYIEGTVDFIFGSSTAFFDKCEIFCKDTGYITAASTPQEAKYGYVFYHCRVSGEKEHAFYLGRPWRPYAHVAFIACDLGEVIKPEGWDNWGNPENEKTAIFVEYQNTGKGSDISHRVSWTRQLTESEASIYYKKNVLRVDFD